jgi:hypothetical protein
MDFEQAKRILRAFEREGVRYVLVGSMAMAAQGLVRATRDIDVFVAPERQNVENLVRALRGVVGDDPNLDEIRVEDLAGEYPAIEYVPPGGDFSVDILSRLGDAFSFDEIESEDVMVEGIHVRVATPRMLYRMKRATIRPQDHLDAAALRERFGLLEED